jgi:hypothetical protein
MKFQDERIAPAGDLSPIDWMIFSVIDIGEYLELSIHVVNYKMGSICSNSHTGYAAKWNHRELKKINGEVLP